MNTSVMTMDEPTKEAVKDLVTAIQVSVDNSPIVKSAVENLQFLGYIPNFTVRMDLELKRPALDGLTDTKVRLA